MVEDHTADIDFGKCNAVFPKKRMRLTIVRTVIKFNFCKREVIRKLLGTPSCNGLYLNQSRVLMGRSPQYYTEAYNYNFFLVFIK